MNNKLPLLLGFPGTDLNNELINHLKKTNPAGVILFKRNIISLEQTRNLISKIRNLLGPVIVAIDHEGGLVSRFPTDVPVPPALQALGRTNNFKFTAKACQLQQDILAYLGINLNLAPVLDLNLKAENSVIGTRAYSADPKKVADYASICIDTHQENKIGTCAKHFPGHGNTSTDSHFSRANISVDSITMERDLLPFKKAIEKKIAAIMTVHLTYNSIDPDRIATVSPKVIENFLRSKLNHQGLILTDCVEMSGISSLLSPAEIAIQSIEAGSDLIISSYSIKQSLDFQLEMAEAIRHKLKEDQIFSKKLEKSRQRIGEFNKEFPAQPVSNVIKSNLAEAVQLHKDTLEIKQSSALKANKFTLVELSNQSKVGINLTETGNQAISELLKSEQIFSYSKLTITELDEFKKIIKELNQQNQGLIFVTANAWKKTEFKNWKELIKESKNSIHLALLDARDLSKTANLEICSFGFNALTGKAVLELLEKI